MNRFLRCDNGATAVEYGLILALVVLLAVMGFQALRGQTQTTYNTVTDSINNAGP